MCNEVDVLRHELVLVLCDELGDLVLALLLVELEEVFRAEQFEVLELAGDGLCVLGGEGVSHFGLGEVLGVADLGVDEQEGLEVVLELLRVAGVGRGWV